MYVKLTLADNFRKQGDQGLGIAIAWFSVNGYSVCIPLTDSQRYDLVVEKDKKLERVQVKTTTRKSPSGFQVELRTKGGNKSGTGKQVVFSEVDAELLFAVTADGEAFLIPALVVNGRKTMVLGEQFKQYKVIHG